MKSDRPKVLHPLAGRPMIGHALDAVRRLRPARTVVVVGRDVDAVAAAAAPCAIAVQDAPRGTGDAVLAARSPLRGFKGDVLITFGDTPLLTAATMRRLLASRCKPIDGRLPAIAVLGMRPKDPGGYGRLVAAADGSLAAIVEHRDATAAERRIGLCNAGAMAVAGRHLFRLLARVGSDNAKGEIYLTDIVALARAEGLPCAVVEGAAEELVGVNSRAELAAAEAILQRRLRDKAMAGGVTMLDPGSVALSFDTRFGRDVVVEPNVFFGPGVRIGDGVTIKGFSHLENATVADGATIGPYARLRPGAEVGEGARIGNFVEVKQSRIEAGAKVNHLAYVGDARVGRGANVGAGAITCNYDGVRKSRTDIGAGAFVGSNSSLVAPVEVGAGAVVGAGSVITRDVPENALALTRAPQRQVAGWSERGGASEAPSGGDAAGVAATGEKAVRRVESPRRRGGAAAAAKGS